MFAASKSGQATGAAPPPTPTPTTDPQFNYVTALLTGDGTNGAQNNTFIDSSPNNFTITRAGNTTQGSVSPYGGNWSNYFDGTGDYLTTPSSLAMALGSTFTVECWIYVLAWNVSGPTILDVRDSNIVGVIYIENNGTARMQTTATSTIASQTGITLNTWIHVAFVSDATSSRVYVNGSNTGATNQSQALFPTTAKAGFIGADFSGGYRFNGYISNLRAVKGTAVYTSNFTPSTTPLTAITNTSLLTCQSNRFIDNSINNFTVTKYGDTSTQVFSPFEPATLTPISYSGYFDGTGDYLSLATNAAFNITSGSTDSFICEFWVKFSSVAANTSLVDNGGLSGATLSNWNIQLNASQQFGIVWGNEGAQQGILASSTVPTTGQWYHIALVKTNADWALFINGARGISYNGINTASKSSATPLYIAYGITPSAGGNGFNGVISNVRIYKGATATAPYLATSTTITVPTSPLTAITNTSLLTCQSNTFVDNSPNNFAITSFGDAKTAIQHPFGTTSALTTGYSTSVASGAVTFNGSSNVLTGPTGNTLFQLTANGGTGLTVEAWIHPTSVAGSRQIATYYSYTDGGSEQGWYFRVLDGQLIAGNAFGGTSRGGGSIPVNTWTHVAFVIDSGSFYVYVNGVSIGTATGVGSQSYSSATLEIGGIKQNGTYTNQVFNGSISNLRITNTAVYTANFTPSKTPLTAISGTTLLTCQSSTSITDASSNVFTITRVGTPVTTVANPFGITSVNGASMYFDGSGDYLNTPSNAAFGFGTGDFTLEGWFYFTGTIGTYQRPWWFGDDNENLEILSSVIRFGGASVTLITGPTAVANTWYHIAYSRASGSGRLYVNGNQVGSTTANSYSSSARTFTLMATSGGSNTSTGYVSNFRIVKGTAVYTSNFVPPVAPVTAISGTSLLLNGTNGGIIDNAMMNDYETVGNAQISTSVVKYGTGSMYFDGTGDYLSASAFQAGLNPNSGNFTIECWVYIPSLPNAEQSICSTVTSVGTGILFGFGGGGNVNKLQFAIGNYNVSNPTVVDSATFPVATWTHVAAVRYNGTIYLYKNGVSVGTPTSASSTLQQPTIAVGAWPQNMVHFNGYIDDLRISTIARYVANFTPPTQAFPTY